MKQILVLANEEKWGVFVRSTERRVDTTIVDDLLSTRDDADSWTPVLFAIFGTSVPEGETDKLINSLIVQVSGALEASRNPIHWQDSNDRVATESLN